MDPIHFFVFLFIRNVFGTMKNKRRKKNVTVHFFPEHFSFVFPIQCIRFLRWSSSLRFSKVYFVSGTVDYLLLPYRIIIFFFINDRKECKHNRNRIRTVFFYYYCVLLSLSRPRFGYDSIRAQQMMVFSSLCCVLCLRAFFFAFVLLIFRHYVHRGDWKDLRENDCGMERAKKNKPDTYMTPIV